MKELTVCPYCGTKLLGTNDASKNFFCRSFAAIPKFHSSDEYSMPLQVDVFLCHACDNYIAIATSNSTKWGIWTRPIHPLSIAKHFPEYVPLQIRADYEEAYSIIHLSPKAAATLARRCMQGIIRDFYGIIKKRLIDEIEELIEKKLVSSDLSTAFADLKDIGNIGAHMEKDVNLIIDIEPNEAKILLDFIEYLIDKTYIEREKHSTMLQTIHTISKEKRAQRKGNPKVSEQFENADTAQTAAYGESAHAKK